MKTRFHKRFVFLLSLLLLGLGFTFFVWVRKEQRQYALNRQLIAVLMKGATKFTPLVESDTKRAIALVEAGANPNTRYHPTSAPSLYEFLNRFLHQSKPSSSKNYNPTALIIACSFYIPSDDGIRVNVDAPQLRQELIHVMLSHGANVSKQDEDGQTALCRAIWCGNIEVINQLLDYGADPNGADVADYTLDSPGYVYHVPEIVALLRQYRKRH